MVGVPRSKGCSTCLRRRVKCDEARPSCGQCKKTGYHCLGYDKATNFINQTIKPGLGTIETPIVHLIKDRPQETTVDELVVLASTFLEISCPRELDLSAFEDKYMLTCLFANYVQGNFGSPWLDLSAEGKLGPTSRTASLAVAGEFFAQFHKQPKFKVPGVELYGTSLRLMRKELAEDENCSPEKFTVPIMIMIMYDFLTWQNGLSCDHFHGLLRVVELCGPDRFQVEPYRSAFESARELLIMMSLHSRKRSIFEAQDWKSIPWAQNPAQKSPANRLLDVLADIPGLLEDETKATISANPGDKIRLRRKVITHLDQLYEWRWAWESINPGGVEEVAVDSADQDYAAAYPPLFNTRFKYTNHVQVNAIGLYNSIQMWLLRLLLDNGGLDLDEVSELFSAHSVRRQAWKMNHESTLLLPGERPTMMKIATEILRSFEFQLASFHKHKDSMIAWVLPISLAHQVFVREQQLPWIEQSSQMLEIAPFSIRHKCLYIAQSIVMFRR